MKYKMVRLALFLIGFYSFCLSSTELDTAIANGGKEQTKLKSLLKTNEYDARTLNAALGTASEQGNIVAAELLQVADQNGILDYDDALDRASEMGQREFVVFLLGDLTASSGITSRGVTHALYSMSSRHSSFLRERNNLERALSRSNVSDNGRRVAQTRIGQIDQLRMSYIAIISALSTAMFLLEERYDENSSARTRMIETHTFRLASLVEGAIADRDLNLAGSLLPIIAEYYATQRRTLPQFAFSHSELLHRAFLSSARAGFTSFIGPLLNAAADAEVVMPLNQALREAATFARPRAVARLLRAGAEIDSVDGLGYSALHLLLSRNRNRSTQVVRTFEVLLPSANFSLTTRDGTSALVMVQRHPNRDLEVMRERMFPRVRTTISLSSSLSTSSLRPTALQRLTGSTSLPKLKLGMSKGSKP